MGVAIIFFKQMLLQPTMLILRCLMYKDTLSVKVPSVADVFEFGNFRNRKCYLSSKKELRPVVIAAPRDEHARFYGKAHSKLPGGFVGFNMIIIMNRDIRATATRVMIRSARCLTMPNLVNTNREKV